MTLIKKQKYLRRPTAIGGVIIVSLILHAVLGLCSFNYVESECPAHTCAPRMFCNVGEQRANKSIMLEAEK